MHFFLGMIDFGDLCHTFLVADPAVAIAYGMLEKKEPVDAACQLIRGYHLGQHVIRVLVLLLRCVPSERRIWIRCLLLLERIGHLLRSFYHI